MKVQCHCGAKYSFEVTPEMARDPVRFICPGCGVDLSGPINDLVRQELGIVPSAAPRLATLLQTAAPAPVAATPAPIPTAAPVAAARTPVIAALAPVAAPTSAPGKLSIARSASSATHGTPTQAAAPQSGESDGGQDCPKHHEPAFEHCHVCRKPICPKCMELFGYVCSPLCRARAESHGINVPVYEGQKSVKEAKQWRKVGLIGAGVGAVVVGLIGLWGWYAFIGCRPHSIFSVRFPEIAYGGNSQLAGKDQFVFLHGGLLARYKLGSKTPVWTNEIIGQKQIQDEVDRQTKADEAEAAEEGRQGVDAESRTRFPTPDELAKDVTRHLQSSVGLYVSGQNIWLEREGTLTKYDWDTGQPGQQVTMTNEYGGMMAPKVKGDELLFTEENPFGQRVVTHFSLSSGDKRTEELGEPVGAEVLAAANKPGPGGKNNKATGGLPTNPASRDAGKPLDPKKVAQQAQSLPYAAKVALPATLSNARHQQQIAQEIKNDEAEPGGFDPAVGEKSMFGRSFVNNKYGYLEWSSKLLEEHIVSHSAMKAPPAKSALENNPSVANTYNVANEILNGMQRDNGGDVVTENESRFQVTIHRPGATAPPDWVGEIIGEPSVFEQQTVTVVAGLHTIIVLDGSNKKLWQAELTHNFRGRGLFAFEDAEDDDDRTVSDGEGPVVERDGAVYVFDEATLSAFDLASGNVRWRVPSIGIVGMFFDDQGAMYVNTTTADLDSLKYSRQIDITKKTTQSILCIECKSGKVRWTIQPGGFVSRVEGKYVLCFAEHQGADLDPDSLTTLPGMNDSGMSIARLDQKTGKVMWNYTEQRAPLHVRFKDNLIQLVFRKEVEVLKFISF